MPAHRARRLTDALDNVPWPSTIIGLVLVAIIGLVLTSSPWSQSPTRSAPVGTVAITPDDPAAPTVVPVQSLGR